MTELMHMSNFTDLVHVPATSALPDFDFQGDRPDEVTLLLPYDQLSVFARQYESSAALEGLPLYVIASLGRLDGPPAVAEPPLEGHDGSEPALPPLAHRPLGLLGTDHAGYASFDLGILRSEETLQALHRVGVTVPGESASVGLVHLWVLPFADPLLIEDALRHGDIGPNIVALRIELDERRLDGRVLGRPMAAMQNPNILDWRMSPGSFTLAGAILVGEDGCETLLPSNLSTQQFRFRQVARVAGKLSEARGEQHSGDGHASHNAVSERYRLGHVFEYTTEWFSIGHSLGQLAYSLPLAPGEIVKLAIVDWSRAESAVRTEDTALSESLVHDQIRDRSLTESVHAVLDEWQRGGTIMGGVAASGGMGSGGMGLGAAGALGGAYTTSSGTRDLTADTSQRISDAFHQATSALRELRSTVVVQNEQAESSNVQTRVVANYNHGHALTLMYYEVLRHYRVVTRLARTRLAVLVDYSWRRHAFRDEGVLLAYRAELEAVLLDDRLRLCFDALGRVQAGRAAFEQAKAGPKAAEPGDAWIDRLTVTFTTGGAGEGGTDGDPYLDLAYVDGGGSNTHQQGPRDTADDRRFGRPDHDDFESGDTDSFDLKPDGPFQWKRLRGFVIGLDGGGDWRLDHVKLEGYTITGDRIPLYDAAFGQDIPDDTTTIELSTNRPPAGPPPPAVEKFVAAADLQTVDLLMRHLEAHRHHYDRALWLGEDPNDRAPSFEGLLLGGRPLLDLIENRAVEASGDWVAFPVAPDSTPEVEQAFKWRDPRPASPIDTFVEQLLTLPTRGVFAEAKLGRCNACELIDNSRFWDWKTSPIPYQAPEITGADAGSRARDPKNLEPTAFPTSLVNIVNPGTLPDPTGLSSALKVLGTPDIFRDMSASKEVGQLLGKLSDNATQLAAQGMKGGSRQDLLKDIRDAGELTPEQKAKLVGELLTKEVGADHANGATPSTGTSPSSPTAGTTTPTTSGGATTPQKDLPASNGATPMSDAPHTTSEPPKSTPTAKGSGKPKLPDPSPATRGLGFLLNFQRVKVATTATGKASVTVRSFGKSGGLTHDPTAYVPGVTEGPPTAKMASAMPENWSDVQFHDGGLMLRSDHAGAPGQITISAVYDIPIVEKGDLVAGIFVAESAAGKLNAKQGTFSMNNSVSYKAPAQGDVVILKVVPHTESVTITSETSSDFESQLASKVGASTVISAEISAADTTKAGSKSSRTVTLAYVTGGLDITQDS